MPLDHYVSQVHLRKFYSPALGDRMHAIWKSNLKKFTPNAAVVCAINDGSTNVYLRENRAIERFLETIEPKYNAALAKLVAGKIDQESIYAIAGFVAYVMTCSPAGMRIRSEPLRSVVETTAEILDDHGLMPPPPPELSGQGLAELLRTGAVQVDVDPKFPQAIGIDSILKLTATFGNFFWDILSNGFDDSPFFTSDFPVAIETTDDPRILNRIVPLAPDLALRIVPSLSVDRVKLDMSFKKFGSRVRKIDRRELMHINRLIVRCAEDAIFYRDNRAWVERFVANNRYYRIEPHTFPVKTSTGTLLISTQRIVARTQLA
jgi:hypothetical protein